MRTTFTATFAVNKNYLNRSKDSNKSQHQIPHALLNKYSFLDESLVLYKLH